MLIAAATMPASSPRVPVAPSAGDATLFAALLGGDDVAVAPPGDERQDPAAAGTDLPPAGDEAWLGAILAMPAAPLSVTAPPADTATGTVIVRARPGIAIAMSLSTAPIDVPGAPIIARPGTAVAAPAPDVRPFDPSPTRAPTNSPAMQPDPDAMDGASAGLPFEPLPGTVRAATATAATPMPMPVPSPTATAEARPSRATPLPRRSADVVSPVAQDPAIVRRFGVVDAPDAPAGAGADVAADAAYDTHAPDVGDRRGIGIASADVPRSSDAAVVNDVAAVVADLQADDPAGPTITRRVDNTPTLEPTAPVATGGAAIPDRSVVHPTPITTGIGVAVAAKPRTATVPLRFAQVATPLPMPAATMAPVAPGVVPDHVAVAVAGGPTPVTTPPRPIIVQPAASDKRDIDPVPRDAMPSQAVAVPPSAASVARPQANTAPPATSPTDTPAPPDTIRPVATASVLPTPAATLDAGALVTPASAVTHHVAATPVDMTHDGWPQAMIGHIERLRDAADALDTRIRLHPDALGGIDVSLHRDGDTVRVALAADRPQTQALLAEARPQLDDLAVARGIRLAGGAPDAAADRGGSDSQRQPPPAPVPRAPIRPRAAVAGDIPDEAATGRIA